MTVIGLKYSAQLPKRYGSRSCFLSIYINLLVQIDSQPPPISKSIRKSQI